MLGVVKALTGTNKRKCIFYWEVAQISNRTNRIDELLENRLLVLKSNVNTIKSRLKTYQKGNLKIKRVKNKTYYCIADENSGKQRYISASNMKDAQNIAQRDYEQSYLKIATKEISDIEKLLAKKYSDSAKNCYSGINEGRKKLIMPFEMSDEDFAKQWLDVPYKSKDFLENDTTEYYTDKGERVRSKSEIIIANMLNTFDIPYKYECPLRLGNILVYPDFTILDVNERREKYLEHFGMMGDSRYVENMMLKVNTYEKNGIYIGDMLLCVFESDKRSLNVNVLRNKIKALILNH